MLIHFSKHCPILIRSRFTQIKFQSLPLILAVAYVEVSPFNASSSAFGYYSSVSASNSSVNFILPLSPMDSDIYWVKIYYLSYLLSTFLSRRLRLVVTLISYFESCQFRLSCLVDFANFYDLFFVCCELTITQISLFALTHQ